MESFLSNTLPTVFSRIQDLIPEGDERERALFLLIEENPSPLIEESTLDPKERHWLQGAFDLARRYHHYKLSQSLRHLNHSSPSLPPQTPLCDQAMGLVPEAWRNYPKEWMGLIAVYPREELGQLIVFQQGARSFVNTDPAELFTRVLLLKPKAFFLFHNHPSGDTTPSQQDWDLTLQVAKTALALGIPLLGHWIVAPQGESWIPVTPFPKKTKRKAVLRPIRSAQRVHSFP